VNDPLRAQAMVRRQVRRRRRWRRLRMGTMAVVVAAAAVAAAYGIDRLVVVVHRFYDEHHHSAPRAVGVTHHVTAATTTTTTTTPGPPRCASSQLIASVTNWREGNGTVEEEVGLTNISSSPCSLRGYPTLGAGAENGTPLAATNTDQIGLGSAGPFGVPPTPQLVSLDHEERASFALTFSNNCDTILTPGQSPFGVTNACYAGVWLEVTPPQGTSPLLVTQPVSLTYATAGFQVGPFVAGSGPPLTGPLPITTTTVPAP
jgi:hypothetical protein